MNKDSELLVVGTVALDTIKTPCGEKAELLGGSAAHFSMSASLFTKVHLAAVVGQDFPDQYIQVLKKKGVDLSSLLKTDDKTFHWEGEYKKENLNAALTLKTELGVLANYVPKITAAQRKIPYVFLANVDPDVQMQLLDLMKPPKLVGLDSMNLWINIKKDSLTRLMKRVDLFVANDGEARALTGENNLIKAAKALGQMGPKFIVVKKGEHGALFYSKDFMFAYPAYPVQEVVDPTGAGDTFAGGLMGYLAQAKKINESTFRQGVLYGSILASFNVEGFAMDKTAGLNMATVNKRMKVFKKFFSC